MDWCNAVDLRHRNDLGERNVLSCAHYDGQFRTELEQLRNEIQQVRTELYRVRLELPGWLFGFWIAAVVGMAALTIVLR